MPASTPKPQHRGHAVYREPAEETWRVFRIMAEFVEAYETLAPLQQAITIFGSARTRPHEQSYKRAEKLAHLLVKDGYDVITGGGPGIMEAANKGAFEAGGTSAGLNISLPHEQSANIYQNVSMTFHYFFCRKVMFVKYSLGFVGFPGGFGTLDEFFETMTLIQTGKVARCPVVLVGTDYWTPLVDWMHDMMLGQFKTISAADFAMFHVTDDINQAAAYLREHIDENLRAVRQPTTQEEAAMPPAERITAEGTRYGVRPMVSMPQGDSRKRPPPPTPQKHPRKSPSKSHGRRKPK